MGAPCRPRARRAPLSGPYSRRVRHVRSRPRSPPRAESTAKPHCCCVSWPGVSSAVTWSGGVACTTRSSATGAACPKCSPRRRCLRSPPPRVLSSRPRPGASTPRSACCWSTSSRSTPPSPWPAFPNRWRRSCSPAGRSPRRPSSPQSSTTATPVSAPPWPATRGSTPGSCPVCSPSVTPRWRRPSTATPAPPSPCVVPSRTGSPPSRWTTRCARSWPHRATTCRVPGSRRCSVPEIRSWWPRPCGPDPGGSLSSTRC